MRPIKFRGKRCDNGEWAYGYYARLRNEFKEWHCIMTEEDASENYIKDCNGYNMIYTPVNHNTVGQFTGLYDKNGKEIYEGDVVKFANPKYGDELLRIGCEDSHIGAFCLCEAGEEDTSRFVAIFGRSDYEPFYCEVIGNIHDNPDLMEGGKE